MGSEDKSREKLVVLLDREAFDPVIKCIPRVQHNSQEGIDNFPVFWYINVE